MYDKQGSVLRVETTINRPGDMKVFRHKEGEPRGPKTWQRLRKGVADLHRRAEISESSNARYLEALAATEYSESLGDTIRDLCRPTMWQGRRVRALQPLESHDMELLNCAGWAVEGDFDARSRMSPFSLSRKEVDDPSERQVLQHCLASKQWHNRCGTGDGSACPSELSLAA